MNTTINRKNLFKKINESNEKKHLETLSASILTNQVLLHFLEELNKLNSTFYKHNLKKYSKLLQKELIKAEELEFDKIYDSDSETTHKITSNYIEGSTFIAKNGFSSMMFLMKCEMVFKENPNRIEKFVDKLLKEYNLTNK